MNDTAIEDLVSQITSGIEGLAAIMAEPSGLPFDYLHEHFEKLEKALTAKTNIDAAFAWLAEMYRAGDKVGSSSTADYLAKSLGITHGEAWSRLKRGKKLFDPLQEPAPTPPPADEDDVDRTTREAEERARRKRAAEEKKAREKSQGALLNEAKRKIIEEGLAFLAEDADPGHFALFNQAVEKAQELNARALRDWVRQAVIEANARGREKSLEDINMAFRNRRITIGQQDEYGGVHVHMYLPGDMAAVFSQAINPKRTTLLEDSDLDVTEDMTYNQRQVQLFVAMCRNFLNTTGPNLAGVGSIVVSMTEEEAANISLADSFPTNTGYEIDALGLIRLGVAGKDFVVTHDKRGRAIHVDTGKRTANLYQRIALFAEQLVCIEPGCSRPAAECDAHHIIPHSNDGPSAQYNFAWMCFGHHRDNNDYRDPRSPFGWADRCAETGRVGKRANAKSDIKFNDSPAAQKSGGAKIRRRFEDQATTDHTDAPDDQLHLFAS